MSRKEDAKCIQRLKDLSRKGDHQARLELLECYRYGHRVSQDLHRARIGLQELSEASNVPFEVKTRSMALLGALDLEEADRHQGSPTMRENFTVRAVSLLSMACGQGSMYAATKLQEFVKRPANRGKMMTENCEYWPWNPNIIQFSDLERTELQELGYL